MHYLLLLHTPTRTLKEADLCEIEPRLLNTSSLPIFCFAIPPFIDPLTVRMINHTTSLSIKHVSAIMPPITRTQTDSIRQVPKKNYSESSSSQSHQYGVRRATRRREDLSHTLIPETQSPSTGALGSNEPRELPHFIIDLSLPPEQRYMEVCAAYRDEMRGLQGLFDEVVGGFVAWVPSVVLRWICWMLLWRVWSGEESAELRVGREYSIHATHADYSTSLGYKPSDKHRHVPSHLLQRRLRSPHGLLERRRRCSR
jgi:hypothetical protein